MKWFLVALRKYATFSGRATRSEYWYFFLFFLLLFIGASMIDGVVGTLGKYGNTGVVGAICILVFLLPSLAVAARRLHDIGKSGWWQLINIIPIIGPIVLIFWLAKDSEPGANVFGTNPKGIV
jgi:uncharacterized membrane protein YhaH (DUF805 family)